MKTQQIKSEVAVNCERPKIGDLCTVRNLACKIVAVRDFGTIDVESIDERNLNAAFRVTGLAFI
jgi:hypothetical protein